MLQYKHKIYQTKGIFLGDGVASRTVKIIPRVFEYDIYPNQNITNLWLKFRYLFSDLVHIDIYN